jgi:hypothetical protein
VGPTVISGKGFNANAKNLASGLSPGIASLLGFLVGLAIILYLVLGYKWTLRTSTGEMKKTVGGFGRSLDGLWSVTQIQLILWTGVILGSYTALSLAAGSFLSSVPTNTLVLVGITSGTVAFTSITNGLQNRSTDYEPGAFMDGFLASEKEPAKPSLIKAQMFSWNMVAILLFIIFVGSNLYNGNYSLPDIGGIMSTIIGISNGVHVATKPIDKKAK